MNSLQSTKRGWPFLGAGILLLLFGAAPVRGQTLFVSGAIGSSTNSGVGVGTNTPIGQFTVQATNPYVTLNSSVAGKQSGLLFYDNFNAAWMIGDNYNNAGDHNLYFLRSGAAGNILFAPDGNGNIGIGTNTPLQKLELSNASYVGLRANLGTYIPTSWQRGNAGGIIFASSNSPDGTGWAYGSRIVNHDYGDGLGLSFDVDYAGTWTNDVLFISGRYSELGHVGIGTTQPTAKLEIVSPSELTLKLAGGVGAGYGYMQFGDSATPSNNWNMGSEGDGSFRIWSGNWGAGVFNTIFKSNGNVGIGTLNPTQKLSVNGTIRAKEVIVETNWSDYVFADAYHLDSLAEVETQIKANRHLRGIPSAKEVSENGISVGEMQAKLLAKIEELTLHQIEQEKRLGAQQAEILTLNERNRSLEERMARLVK